jgi:hypothetical protein
MIQTLPSVCPLDCPDTCSLSVTVDNQQQFPLIAFQHFPLMSMGQFDHRFWFNASQMVIKRGAMSV